MTMPQQMRTLAKGEREMVAMYLNYGADRIEALMTALAIAEAALRHRDRWAGSDCMCDDDPCPLDEWDNVWADTEQWINEGAQRG